MQDELAMDEKQVLLKASVDLLMIAIHEILENHQELIKKIEKRHLDLMHEVFEF